MIAVQMMPPACPVEPHVGGYHRHDEEFRDATGLPGGASRWQLTQPMPENLKMPPACPVEPHVGSYQGDTSTLKMPPACPVEPHVGS